MFNCMSQEHAVSCPVLWLVKTQSSKYMFRTGGRKPCLHRKHAVFVPTSKLSAPQQQSSADLLPNLFLVGERVSFFSMLGLLFAEDLTCKSHAVTNTDTNCYATLTLLLQISIWVCIWAFGLCTSCEPAAILGLSASGDQKRPKEKTTEPIPKMFPDFFSSYPLENKNQPKYLFDISTRNV